MATSLQGLATACLSGFCIVVFILYCAFHSKKRFAQSLPFHDILVFLNKVYLTTFLKLIDPLEEAYLREKHTRVEFRKLQTLRIQQAREFFRKMVSNAVVLQKLWIQTFTLKRPYRATPGKAVD